MNYLLSVQGTDKNGLVEALATSIESAGGNWLESRLCRLGGRFAGIISVEFQVPPTQLPESVQTLECRWTELQEAETVDSETKTATIQILAADRPGIIRQISALVNAHNANVEEIESRVRCAPFSGEKMFEAIYTVSYIKGEANSGLAESLESLAEELMCDIDLNYNREN